VEPRRAQKSREKRDENDHSPERSGAKSKGDSLQNISQAFDSQSASDKNRREDEKEMTKAIVHGRLAEDDVEEGEEEGGEQ
jgi:hypothetical protein